MKVVSDTNVILRAVSSKSEYEILLDELYFQTYSLVVGTEVLFEYEEKISEFFGKSIAKDFLDFLIILPNVEKVDAFFNLTSSKPTQMIINLSIVLSLETFTTLLLTISILTF